LNLIKCFKLKFNLLVQLHHFSSIIIDETNVIIDSKDDLFQMYLILKIIMIFKNIFYIT
jgi:hypothetical protein